MQQFEIQYARSGTSINRSRHPELRSYTTLCKLAFFYLKSSSKISLSLYNGSLNRCIFYETYCNFISFQNGLLKDQLARVCHLKPMSRVPRIKRLKRTDNATVRDLKQVKLRLKPVRLFLNQVQYIKLRLKLVVNLFYLVFLMNNYLLRILILQKTI